jgi:capsular polysaccharide biosynthesis protein
MQDVILRWLRALGIKPDMIVMTDYDEPVHCERLAFITGLSRHGQYVSPLALHAASLLAIGSVPGHHKKLFVRRGTPRKGRALLNEIEIDERLAREGFLSIDPSEMTAEEQINIFRGAEIIIAVAGAAMANIAFCRPDTKVMALVPGSFPDTLLWFICQHCRLDYTEIRGEQINDEGEGWTDGFNVGLDVIERILTELMPPEQCLERTLASPVSEAVSLQEGEDWHSFASRSP